MKIITNEKWDKTTIDNCRLTPFDWRHLHNLSLDRINEKVSARIAELELRLECCRDASTGKDLLINALETKITELEYQVFQYAMKNERSSKAYVEKCNDGSFNVCFGISQRKYVPAQTVKDMKQRIVELEARVPKTVVPHIENIDCGDCTINLAFCDCGFECYPEENYCPECGAKLNW